jgi:membrane dipeptidase
MRSVNPPLIDLHEDISLYYVTQGAGLRFGVADFGVDLEGRHCDLPKYERSRTRLVFGAIASLTPTISPERVERLARSYGSPFGGYRVRAPLLLALEHFNVYRNLLAVGTDYFGLLNMPEPRGLEEMSKLGNLWRELERRGLGDEEIMMMAYGNAMRVVRENASRWRLSSLASP